MNNLWMPLQRRRKQALSFVSLGLLALLGTGGWSHSARAQSTDVPPVEKASKRVDSTKLELEGPRAGDDSAASSPGKTVPREQETDSPSSAQILNKIVESEIQAVREVDRLNDRVEELLQIQKERLQAKRERSEKDAAKQVVSAPSRSKQPPESIGQLAPTGAKSATEPKAGPAIPESSKKLLDSPPDPLALADSLYRSEEWAIAIDTYHTAEQQVGSTSDLLWIRYQMATCYRKLGQREKAQKIYLELANTAPNQELPDPDKNDLVISAKWWLDHLDAMERMALQAKIQIMEEIISRSGKE